MALVKCEECGREISDKAVACIGCGAPVNPKSEEPDRVTYSASDGTFAASVRQMVALASKAILTIGWKIDSADEQTGIVTFTTGMTWGSFSGVSGSIYMDEVGAGRFRPIGSAKQNLRGGQLIALNIGNEAQRKVDKVINTMAGLVGKS